MPTEDFEYYKNNPDLKGKELLPDGTLIFMDEAAWLVIGPTFTNLAESDDFAYGDSKDQAIENYLEEKLKRCQALYSKKRHEVLKDRIPEPVGDFNASVRECGLTDDEAEILRKRIFPSQYD